MPRIGSILIKSLLLIVALTAMGGLAAGALIVREPRIYQADAYVDQLAMPVDVRATLGADQAAVIDAFYHAGPLQDTVLENAARQLLGFTSADLRAQVQVSPEPYTPLVIISARASQPDISMAVANAVASTWVAQLTGAYDGAFTAVEATLTTTDDALTRAITVTEGAIVQGSTRCGPTAAVRAPRCDSTQALTALQDTLNADLRQQTLVRAQLTNLAVRRAQVVRIAYLAIPADPDTTTAQPDVARILGAGLVGGFVLGALLALWLLRGPVRQLVRKSGGRTAPQLLATSRGSDA